ncbi:MAG: hypothetical protein CL908_08960 [Deltaproteobacteria bacterium]|nr:hypothetical protein [Deltaproteobacteria bacterium]
MDEQLRSSPACWLLFRPHLYLHAALLVLVAGVSWWGEGAAFLILYAGALVVTGALVASLHAAAFLRARFSGGPGNTASPEPATGRAAFLPWRATAWLLRGLVVVLIAALSSGLILGVVARLSEPLGSFPGGDQLFPVEPLQLPGPGRQIPVGSGLEVNAIERGSGPPIVLVHGLPGSAYDWKPTTEAMAARGYGVLAYVRGWRGWSSWGVEATWRSRPRRRRGPRRSWT